jgi:integrase
LAVRKKYIAATPLTKDVRTPKVRKKKFQMPEIQRLKDVLQEARKYRLYEILEVPAATGIRLGELCALLRFDFDPESGCLRISKSLEDTKHGVRVKPAKSDEPRILPLPPYIVAMLQVRIHL